MRRIFGLSHHNRGDFVKWGYKAKPLWQPKGRSRIRISARFGICIWSLNLVDTLSATIATHETQCWHGHKVQRKDVFTKMKK